MIKRPLASPSNPPDISPDCVAWREPSHCQTEEIQVYDAEIAPSGVLNLTWHNNSTLGGQQNAEIPRGVAPYSSLNGVPEWAHGVNDWFEAKC